MLPVPIRDYLMESSREWKLEGGEIRELMLYGADDVPLREFKISSYSLLLEGLLKHDPKKTREYEGYDLVESCNSYNSEGILVWFPALGAYGSWDCDHQTIIKYPRVTWAQIADDPTWYVNGQWYPDRVTHVKVNPWSPLARRD